MTKLKGDVHFEEADNRWYTVHVTVTIVLEECEFETKICEFNHYTTGTTYRKHRKLGESDGNEPIQSEDVKTLHSASVAIREGRAENEKLGYNYKSGFLFTTDKQKEGKR